MLKADHLELKAVSTNFQQAGQNATETKGDLVKTMIELLTVHTYLENEVMYPEVRRLLPDLEDDILDSYEQHHVADLLVIELAAMSPDAERYNAKTTVLIQNVTHHIDEEEQHRFPKVRDRLGRKQLHQIGEQLLGAKEKAPRGPAQPSALKKTIDASIK